MAIDTNDFFRQATLRICGSLDIETALWSALKYLEKFIPLSGLNLAFAEPGLPAIESLAYVSLYRIEKLYRIIPLPREIRADMERAWIGLQDVMIINQPENDLTIRTMTRLVERPDLSVMLMRLKIQDKRLFSLVAFADGRDQYNREHAHLLSLLHDPFAIAMSNALKHEEVFKLKEMLADDNRFLHQELLRLSGDEIIGRDRGLKKVFEMVRHVAPLNSPVILLGETGVGKEVVANAIHYSSPRRNGPFIKVNCGAIPETLMDSELFGHEKGAFTGAVAQKRGRFERAHKGTILLDEIGELPPQAQVRLLRVIQNKEIERVGGTKPIPVDIRIIASTHRDLKKMVSSRQFREDLWFRLNVFPIKIPPLRDRKEDIQALVQYFIKRKSIEKNLPPPSSIAGGAMDSLKSYHWPGNVRELENVVERTLVQYHGRNDSHSLNFDDFLFQKTEHGPSSFSAQVYAASEADQMFSQYLKQILKRGLEYVDLQLDRAEMQGLGGDDDELFGIDKGFADNPGQNFKPSSAKLVLAKKAGERFVSSTSERDILKLDEVLSFHIQKALDLAGGKIHGPGGAAELLGINPNTLRSRMRKLGLLRNKNNPR